MNDRHNPGEREENAITEITSRYVRQTMDAHREDHFTTRLFIRGSFIVIAITVVATFAVVAVDGGKNEQVIAVAREIASVVISGLVGVLAGASMRR